MKLRLRLSPAWCSLALLAFLAHAGPALGRDAADAQRIVAVSDIHGAHSAFVATLTAAGLLDDSLGWRGGRAQLVVVGDILDRGGESRRSLDLLMRLEQQATLAGGGVQVLLGNHELMNLVGDLRYVSRGEYAAFAADESATMRGQALRQYAGTRAASGSAEAIQREFDDRFPPGYFAHRAAFAADGKYGSWLLQKPLLLRVNDTVFVHAGISALLNETNATVVDGELRRQLVDYLGVLRELQDAGIVNAMTGFYELPARLAPLRAGGASPLSDPARLAQLERLLQLHESMIHSSSSPLWYRGNASCPPLVEQDRLDAALGALGARRVVIGHTPTWGRRVWSRFDGRVIQIDAGMLKPYYGGQGAALVIEGERISAVYENAPAAVDVVEQPARVGALSPVLDARSLETALAQAAIIGSEPVAEGELLRLRWQDSDIDALFVAAARDGFLPELAAYRLDRLLGLDMVPAVVRREIDGRAGTLQYVPPDLISEADRAANNTYVEAWCPLRGQFNAMYVFDALIRNEGRSLDRILYNRGNGALILRGHDRAFTTAKGIPRHLQKVELELSPLWHARLAGLESEPVRGELLEVLDSKRLKALLARARLLRR